jgi:hypothetical protein
MRGHPANHAALPDAAAEPALYRGHHGKRLVVIVGQKKAMAIAVKGKQSPRRWSKLRDWLMLRPQKG